MKLSQQHPVRAVNTPAAAGAVGLAAAACLLACSGSGTLGEQPTIRGQVVDPFSGAWIYGSGFSMNLELEDQASARAVLATAPIDDQGNFMITLPPLSKVEAYLQERSVTPYAAAASCTNTITVSTLPAKSSVARFVATKGSVGYAIMPVMLDRSAAERATRVTYYHHVYSDRDFAVEGNIRCPNGSGPSHITAKESYKSGWNVFADTYASLDTLHPTRTTANFPVPDGVKWYPIK